MAISTSTKSCFITPTGTFIPPTESSIATSSYSDALAHFIREFLELHPTRLNALPEFSQLMHSLSLDQQLLAVMASHLTHVLESDFPSLQSRYAYQSSRLLQFSVILFHLSAKIAEKLTSTIHYYKRVTFRYIQPFFHIDASNYYQRLSRYRRINRGDIPYDKIEELFETTLRDWMERWTSTTFLKTFQTSTLYFWIGTLSHIMTQYKTWDEWVTTYNPPALVSPSKIHSFFNHTIPAKLIHTRQLRSASASFQHTQEKKSVNNCPSPTKKREMICECGNTHFVWDHTRDEQICSNCGIVQQAFLFPHQTSEYFHRYQTESSPPKKRREWGQEFSAMYYRVKNCGMYRPKRNDYNDYLDDFYANLNLPKETVYYKTKKSLALLRKTNADITLGRSKEKFILQTFLLNCGRHNWCPLTPSELIGYISNEMTPADFLNSLYRFEQKIASILKWDPDICDQIWNRVMKFCYPDVADLQQVIMPLLQKSNFCIPLEKFPRLEKLADGWMEHISPQMHQHFGRALAKIHTLTSQYRFYTVIHHVNQQHRIFRLFNKLYVRTRKLRVHQLNDVLHYCATLYQLCHILKINTSASQIYTLFLQNLQHYPLSKVKTVQRIHSYRRSTQFRRQFHSLIVTMIKEINI